MDTRFTKGLSGANSLKISVEVAMRWLRCTISFPSRMEALRTRCPGGKFFENKYPTSQSVLDFTCGKQVPCFPIGGGLHRKKFFCKQLSCFPIGAGLHSAGLHRHEMSFENKYPASQLVLDFTSGKLLENKYLASQLVLYFGGQTMGLLSIESLGKDICGGRGASVMLPLGDTHVGKFLGRDAQLKDVMPQVKYAISFPLGIDISVGLWDAMSNWKTRYLNLGKMHDKFPLGDRLINWFLGRNARFEDVVPYVKYVISLPSGIDISMSFWDAMIVGRNGSGKISDTLPLEDDILVSLYDVMPILEAAVLSPPKDREPTAAVEILSLE
ncbi:uncharacterized protein G2W53_026581 [Senna tora]|uniref:Uncharacterized protein n=1 Tax=Senna tora TaxID=362788 RepID=A0A834THH2_9FABA|nr:uncharacterized protein G2W53_026581 [Senna tora]